MDYREIGNSQLFVSSRSGEKIVLDTDFNSDFVPLKHILSLTNTIKENCYSAVADKIMLNRVP